MILEMITKQNIEMAGFGLSMLFVILYFIYLCLEKTKNVHPRKPIVIASYSEDEDLEMLARVSSEATDNSPPPTYEQLDEQPPPSYVSVLWKKLRK